jgi:5-formyltetrahydrofolate cyclo-ligase
VSLPGSSSAKREGRRAARVARVAMSPLARSAASSMICAQIISSPRFASASFVAVYCSMEVEVSVSDIADAALSRGKRVAVPLIVGDGLMEFCEVLDFAALVPDAFGILSPLPGSLVVPVGAIDLIVVPLVGFDLAGNRIGGGKGYYDRVLAREPGFRVGVAFDAQCVPLFDPDPWDVTLPVVVTESGVRVGRLE